MKFLTTHFTLETICVCSCKHNSNWLASYIHTCTNEAHSVAYLQDLIPTLAAIIIGNTYLLAKLGIKSCQIVKPFLSNFRSIPIEPLLSFMIHSQ